MLNYSTIIVSSYELNLWGGEVMSEKIDNQKWLVRVVFEDNWVLMHRKSETLPIDKLLENVSSRYPDKKILSEGLTECILEIEEKEYNVIKEKLDEILKEMRAENNTLHLDVVKMEESPSSSDKKKVAIENIHALIGVDEFKELAREIEMVAPQILKYKSRSTFMRRSYLFSIGDGCGFTTMIDLFSQLLKDVGIFSTIQEIIELNANIPLQEMLDEAVNYSPSERIVCFDLTRWMDKTSQPEFNEFLCRLRSMNDDQIFIFRIPLVDEQTRYKLKSDLSDVLTVREVTVTPYTLEELHSYAISMLEQKGFSMMEESVASFEQRLIDEKSDGRFYSFTTVKKIVDEMLYQRHLSAAQTGEDERIILPQDVPRSVKSSLDRRPAMQQLDDLVGIEKIKERLLEIVSQIELANSSKNTIRPSLHMQFVGNPGTGKTTVARILGQLLKEKGILSKGQLFEYAGRDFCGQYIGETAPKTAAMCRDAYGSILFIDEAYSLYRGDRDSKDFGREAIDTLISQMENHRDDLMVIMAGYPEDMKILMNSNAGLSSRMPYSIEFPNYDREALFEIFMKMVEASFEYDSDLEETAKTYFFNLDDQLINSEEFANARFVRNLFERTWGKASTRGKFENNEKFVLRGCDFDKAAADREFKQLQEKRVRKVGF